MFTMDNLNMTQPMLAAESTGPAASTLEKGGGNGNEYFYVLIVMSFYGIFLMGIMLDGGKSWFKCACLLLFSICTRLLFQ
uniref:Uncharacterized protein n=1 Tax=Podarcis muralis TaxID=64176 RepID=A0A670JPP2_PODMU